MSSHLSRRILQSLVSLLGLIAAVFFLVRMTGNPANLYLPLNASQELRQEFVELHGFDDPLIVQFGRYLRDIASFDLGMSLRRQQPALEVVLEAFPYTLQLVAVTLVISILVAVIIGSLAAFRPNSLFDRLSTLISLASASTPDFWIAIMGILLFAVTFRWLPTSGTGSLANWVLPIIVLTIRPIGLLVQVVRSSMINALSAPYIRTARAKGARERSVIFVHSLRNAALPIITVAGDLTVGVVNGAVIVETIFGWPGIGKLMIDAILTRDYAVVQASILVTAVVIFALNIVIDLLYGMLDPRVETA